MWVRILTLVQKDYSFQWGFSRELSTCCQISDVGFIVKIINDNDSYWIKTPILLFKSQDNRWKMGKTE